MRQRLYGLAMFGLVYLLDPEVVMALFLLETAWWYFGISRSGVKSNGF